jgi:hypothetical protein
MSELSTAGRLFQTLNGDSASKRDAVADAAGIAPDRAAGAMIGALHLTLAEQLRLSEATLVVAPEHKRDALKLREKVLSARSDEAGDLVDRRGDPPTQRVEKPLPPRPYHPGGMR